MAHADDAGVMGGLPSRRAVLLATLGLGAVPLLAACSGTSTSSAGGKGAVNFLSTQFTPIEERQRFEGILKSRVPGVKVAYNPVQSSVFGTTLKAQLSAGKVTVGLIGGLHGELVPYAQDLLDLDDVIAQLGNRRLPDQLTSLAKLGGTTTKYVPWMQASYILAINKKALQWLPSRADVQKLTYEQLLDWTTAARQGNHGKPVFGLPAGLKGLYHRFLQGYLLPSFTGAQITHFRSPDAVQAWQYLRELWANTAPASTNYDYMQEPLARGEVLIAWDHVARLIDAPATRPDDWLMVPAPRGPKGLGYMLVVAGLAIPKGGPHADKARDVITALSTPDAQADVLRQNAFFPVVGGAAPTDLPPAVALERTALDAQQHASDAILSLPPVGLGEHDGEVSQIFKDCFTQICLNGKGIQSVLDAQARQLNSLLDEAKAPCWAPDPTSSGQTCRA